MSRRPRSSPRVKADHYRPTEMTMTTLRKMEERGFRATRRLEHGSESYIHDATSPYYSWLLPGWLAEERVVESGRTYRDS
ncbi:hypothetical protein BVRB_2g024710 isoform A [Beta vulgaris subsp. vulgaris]|nr:hypothetical protein BVRB_2g024710 isoform A [Beta vulgaris subsp. vulgaris]